MSSRGIGSLLFRLGADIKDFETNLKTAERELKSFQYKAQRIGRDLTTSITLPLAAIAAKSVMAFDAQAKSIAQVEAGIKSTGGAAGLTSQELQKMASDLQKITTYGDEDILKSVTAQLLTFTNVTKNEFPKAQKAILDISARMGQDLKSSAIMVGKALNDPILGLTALRRVGIQFTADQEKVIRSLVETGNMAGAQQKILQELERQFGGSAEAMVSGLGSVQQMWNAIGDASEQVGKIIVPYLERMARRVKDLAEGFAELDEDTQKFIIAAAGIVAAIGPGLLAINQLIKVKTALVSTIKVLEASLVKLSATLMANPYYIAAAALAALTASMIYYRSKLQEATELNQAWVRISKKVNEEVGVQGSKIKTLTDIINDSNTAIDKRRAAIAELQNIIPEYNASLTDEGELVDNNTEAIEKYITRLRAKIRLQVLEEELTQAIKAQRQAQEDLDKATNKAVSGMQKWYNIFRPNWIQRTAAAVGDARGEVSELDEVVANLEEALKRATGEMLLFGDTAGGTGNPLTDAGENVSGLTDDLKEQVKTVDILSNSWKAFVSFVKANSNMDLSSIQSGRMTGMQSQGLQTDQVILPEKKQYTFGLQPLVRGNQQAVDNIKAAWQNMQDFAAQVSSNIAAGFTNMGIAFADSLGQMVSGQMTLRQGLSGILSAFGEAMQQLGALFVSAGVAATQFWSSLTNPASAPAAIAGGIALIAAGAAIKAFASNGFSIPGMIEGGIVPQGFPNDSYMARLTSGEVVLPPKKLDELMNKVGGGAGPIDVFVNINAKAKGSELLYVVESARATRRRNIGR